MVTRGKERERQRQRERWGGRVRSSVLRPSGDGVAKASQSTRWDQSRERRGCRGTMLLSAAEKKVHVQTERHDNFCPPALCFAPYIKNKPSSPCCEQGPGDRHMSAGPLLHIIIQKLKD